MDGGVKKKKKYARWVLCWSVRHFRFRLPIARSFARSWNNIAKCIPRPFAFHVLSRGRTLWSLVKFLWQTEREARLLRLRIIFHGVCVCVCVQNITVGIFTTTVNYRSYSSSSIAFTSLRNREIFSIVRLYFSSVWSRIHTVGHRSVFRVTEIALRVCRRGCANDCEVSHDGWRRKSRFRSLKLTVLKSNANEQTVHKRSVSFLMPCIFQRVRFAQRGEKLDTSRNNRYIYHLLIFFISWKENAMKIFIRLRSDWRLFREWISYEISACINSEQKNVWVTD